MLNINIWEKYKKICKIEYGTFGEVFKVKNIKTGEYFAMKEIEKNQFEGTEDKLLNEVEIMKKINTENNVLINEVINNKEYLYIIMDLCEYNLEDYIKRRKKPISINELKEVLNQLNNTFKIMLNENIIHGDIKPKNILISLDRLDKCLIKLSDYGSSRFINQSNSNSFSITGTLFSMAPEVLKDQKELINSKSDIWSLGILIYYMLFKEYPYNGRGEYQILKEIESNKKLKSSDNEVLNDLLNKMLKNNINERLSWEEYFNHPFFKQENNIFNFKCKFHNQNMIHYCKNCKLNICEKCLNQHSSHQFIHFSNIGLNNEEINQIDILFKGIEKNINSFNQLKNEIQSFLNEMKIIKENISIYENDEKNNYKKYYIDILKKINNQLENKININFINLKGNNFIICEYNIKKDKLNQPIGILNSYEEAKRKHPRDWNWENIKIIENEKEIKENCKIYLNNKRIDFCYKYEFEKIDKNEITIFTEIPLKSMSYMFSYCSLLTSLNLSNFNTNNVNNMENMFSDCCSLTSLNFSNFNTNNVKDMSSMFYNCSSLTSLNLFNFNTNNVNNMWGMFYNCSSLTSLNLSSFNTNNVKDMGSMFYNCSSLTSLNLTNFNTNNVNNMKSMFKGLNKKNCKLICNDNKILKKFS